MKKLVLMLAVAFSVSLFSCGGNKAAEEAADTTAVAVEEVAVVEEPACCGDSCTCDSCTCDSCPAAKAE